MVKTINKKRASKASRRMLKIKSKKIVPNLKDVQKKMAGRLPQWKKLEGKADKVLASMFGADREHPIKYTQKEHEEFVADEH